MKTLISIIIPTFNRAHLIGDTLNSILNQTYTSWECIIVDDGSIDNTQDVVNEFVKKDNRFQYHKRPAYKSKGPNSCRNYGFEKSVGSLIQFFDSDDLMKLNCLEVKSSYFLENIDLVICKLSLYDFEKNIEIKQSNIISKDLIYDYFAGKVALYICGPLWNRSFLETKRFLFNESIVNCDDWDFNMNMLYFNPKYIIVNEALIFYRRHHSSLSKEIEEQHLSEIRNVSNLLDQHLTLIKKNKISKLRKFYKYAIDYNKYYLKEAIVKKDKIQYLFLFRISKYCLAYNFWNIFFRIWMLKVFYLFFGKIFKIFKNNNFTVIIRS